MHFLYPWFLFALLVLAIPVIIHLFQFRRYKSIIFPSIAFLKNIDTQSKNKNKLKHLLVLASRCCALAALVLAFSIPGCGNMAKEGAKFSVSIFIDNSFSMEGRDSDGILFEKAKQQAYNIIQSFGDNAEFQILSNSRSPSMQVAVSANEALKLVDEMRIEGGSLNLSEIFRMQDDFFGRARYENQKSYVISDFQRGMFREKLTAGNDNREINFVQISSGVFQNVAVDSAWLLNPFAMAGEKNTLNFRLFNSGSENMEEVGAKLVIDGQSSSAAALSIAAGSYAIGKFDFIVPKSHPDAWIEIEDPGMSFDNKLFINVAPSVQLDIQLQSANQYVNSALKANTFINVINTAGLGESDAVVMANFNGLSESQTNDLYGFVMKGGTCVIVPENGIDIGRFNKFAAGFGFPEVKQVGNVSIELLAESFKHPFFEPVFTSLPKLAQLPSVTSYLSTSGSAGNGEAILSLQNGDPVLLLQRIGRGKCFLFLNSLQPVSGNLVSSSLFFPLITNTLIPSNIHSQLYGVAGSGKSMSLNGKYEIQENAFVIQKDKNEWMPELQNGSNGTEIFIGSYLNEAGNYTLQKKKGNEILEKFALNYNRLESDTRQIEKDFREKQLEGKKINWLEYSEMKNISAASVADSGIWRLFIWLAAAFFAVEIILLVFGDKLLGRLMK